MNNTTVPEYGSLNKLYSALIECFTVILAGYLAGCTGMIKPKYGNGIKVFVWNLCLPSMVLLGMWELNFREVNWKFLSCIFIAKVTIFFLVLVITLLAYRPVNLGVAGIYGIFTTASNDFALGYPILKALYGNESLYLKYIYLFAPISLAFLNPIGFILMETHNANTLTNLPQRQSKLMRFLHIFIDVIRNPIVMMTILGIACNLIFGQEVPGILKNILTELGNAFSATALFFLGLNLVGKAKKQLGFGLVVPFLLIITKTILLPLIIWEIVSAVQPGSTVNETEAFGTYGFLYGTFPTAPSVFIFASQYSMAEHIVASGLVLCTILSAPLMFISAKMRMMMCYHSINYTHLIQGTSFDISILSLIACVWVFVVLIMSSRWKKMPHQLTLCLTVSQMVGAIGVICYHLRDESVSWQSHVDFALISIGNLSSICWASLLSVVICVIRTQRTTIILRYLIIILLTGTALPVVLTGIFLLFTWENSFTNFDPSFQYGNIQAYVQLSLNLVSIIITTSSLVYSQRYLAASYQLHRTSQNSSSINNGDLVSANSVDPDVSTGNIQSSLDLPASATEFSANHLNNLIPTADHDDDLLLSTPIYECHTASSESEAHLLNTDDSDDLHVTFYSETDRTDLDGTVNGEQQCQILRHLILLLCLLFTMCVAFFLSLWRLSGDVHQSGAYVEVVFLHCVLTNGQGFLLFLIFGLDTEFVISPFVARCRRLFCIANCSAICADARDKQNENVNKICHQFSKYHRTNCQAEIAKDIRYGLNVHHSAFMGNILCRWLINAGLTEDTSESLEYGQKLLQGNIIKNVSNNNQSFCSGYLYCFS